MDSFYVTNAVLCGRQGEKYRGEDNFSAERCVENCQFILMEQIDIIKPLVILTLGRLPFDSICKSKGIKISNKLGCNLEKYNKNKGNIINIGEKDQPIFVLPVYHPAASKSKSDQLTYYYNIWELLMDYYKRDLFALQGSLDTYSDFRKKLDTQTSPIERSSTAKRSII